MHTAGNTLRDTRYFCLFPIGILCYIFKNIVLELIQISNFTLFVQCIVTQLL